MGQPWMQNFNPLGNRVLSCKQPVPGLPLQVIRTPPTVAKQYAGPALFDISWLSTPGTAAFLAGLVAGPLPRLSFKRTMRVFVRGAWPPRLSLLAIMAMLRLGCLTRYCGMDATMGTAMSHTGALFRFSAHSSRGSAWRSAAPAPDRTRSSAAFR